MSPCWRDSLFKASVLNNEAGGCRTDVELSSLLPPALRPAAPLMALCLLQSKEIICQLQEDLMKLLNELYTVNRRHGRRAAHLLRLLLQEHQALLDVQSCS